GCSTSICSLRTGSETCPWSRTTSLPIRTRSFGTTPLSTTGCPPRPPLVNPRRLLAQLDGPLVRRHLGVTIPLTGRDRLTLDAQLLPLDRDGPVLLLGDDPLTDPGLAPRHSPGVDVQLLLGAGQGLLAGLRPPLVGRVRTSRRGGGGGRGGGRAPRHPAD